MKELKAKTGGIINRYALIIADETMKGQNN